MHHFHIPVMGIAYTLETPMKVAHYGISSVMSIADHRLVENIRKYYHRKSGWTFKPIPDKHEEDGRAKRITAYLNMVNHIVSENFASLKQGCFNASSRLTQYFEMLPEDSSLKQGYHRMLQLGGNERKEAETDLKSRMQTGSIDVNIMTKLDKVNYSADNQPLSTEYNDAHAALRGFANSDLEGSVVFSAGINTRLYSYISNFSDFFPDAKGYRKKGVIVKVSDYKSALVQGKFLAKKGIWVSEFRIESGLNCGGHAFATDGHLLGPILQEFKDKREELFHMLYQAFTQSLTQKEMPVPSEQTLPSRITVQGGIGTYNEQEFLIQQYGVDSVGWGSPFLLVPEAVTIDQSSQKLMAASKEKDLYLSHVSPLGVPFNSIKGTTEDQSRQKRILNGKPGSPCNKKYLVSNTEFTDKPVCTASRTYQEKKLKELDKKEFADERQKEKAYEKVVEKTCICNGLTNPALFNKGLAPDLKGSGVSICPGPNMAYFSDAVDLKKMIDHIYGRVNLLNDPERPDLFLKELKEYVRYFEHYFDNSEADYTEKTVNYLKAFREHLLAGIDYYKSFFKEIIAASLTKGSKGINELDQLKLMVDKQMSRYTRLLTNKWSNRGEAS